MLCLIIIITLASTCLLGIAYRQRFLCRRQIRFVALPLFSSFWLLLCHLLLINLQRYLRKFCRTHTTKFIGYYANIQLTKSKLFKSYLHSHMCKCISACELFRNTGIYGVRTKLKGTQPYVFPQFLLELIVCCYLSTKISVCE